MSSYDWQQRPEDLVLHHRHILGHVLTFRRERSPLLA
jgi:hypothetical protein